MIDLSAAGRRLAATRLGPTPPVHALECRRARRARRRRLVAAGWVAVGLAAAILLAVGLSDNSSPTQQVVTAPSPPRPVSTVTLPPALAVVGSTAYDYVRLRLWLPSGWTTSTSSCHTKDRVVYFPTDYSGGPQSVCTTQEPAARVVVRPFDGTIPSSARKTVVHGIAVSVLHAGSSSATWDVPALQVQLLITGGSGEKVADTLEASALQEIFTQSFPTTVPSSWKTVTFDGFQAKVPAGWPTHRIVVTKSGNTTSIRGLPPGNCSPPLFHVASVYLGADPGISCPFIPETQEPPTDDGLWLQTSTSRAPLGTASPDSREEPGRLIDIGAAQALVFPGLGDAINVQIADGGRRTDAVIGLGPNPAVAEAILSSITPTPAH